MPRVPETVPAGAIWIWPVLEVAAADAGAGLLC